MGVLLGIGDLTSEFFLQDSKSSRARRGRLQRPY